MLALGSDAALKAVALMELRGADSAEQQAAIGNAWWDAAETRQGAERDTLRLRAGSWYRQAEPKLAGGLAGLKIKQRLAEISKLGHEIPTASSAPVATLPSPNALKWIDLRFEPDLRGWKAYGSGTWTVGESAILKGEGMEGCLLTDRDYDDFELRLQFRIGKDSNSGIFLRAWPDGRPDGKEFLEVQILDDTSLAFGKLIPAQRTAALYQIAAPSPPVRCLPDKWHAMTIRAEGPNIRVQYDGQAVLDMDLTKTTAEIQRRRRESGRIGLQAFGGTVEFRNMAFRSLRAP